MKKHFKKLTCFISVLSMLVMMFTFMASPAMADATRVVTLGQDLSDEQEAFIINYFGVDLSTARVIYVNNQQEREYVGSWIPLEQIGNITISSAYVQPTTSGGIQVRTANLTYVTGNMIASVLSTAGITNCNVVAAAPFPVSGTGALTGVMIAYQEATGKALDNTKRDLAVQEFTVTQQASGSIGENEALQLVNAVKMNVIQSDVPAEDTQQIADIVDQVVADMDQSLAINGNGNQIDSVNMDQSVSVDNSTYNDYSVTNISNSLTPEDRQMLIDLASRIAEQEYDTAAVLETLERVNDNLADKTSIELNVNNGNTIDNSSSSNSSSDNTNNNNNENSSSSNNNNSAVNTVDNEDSIFNDLNTDSLPADVQSATDEEGMAEIEEQQKEEAAEAPAAPADAGFPEMNEEVYVYNPEVPQTDQQPAEQPESYDMPEYTEVVVPEPQYEEPAEQPEEQTEPYDMPEYTEVVVPEPQYEEPAAQPEEQTESYDMPEYTEEVIPEPQYEEPDVQPEEQTESYDMPEYTEEVVPEPQEYAEPVYDGSASGQWQTQDVPAGQTLREDVQEVWNSMDSTFYDGVDLTPAVYLGSQTVEGLNYGILCTGTEQTPEGGEENALYMVVMYEPLDGSAYITKAEKVDLDAWKQAQNAPGAAQDGGWEFSRSAEAGTLEGPAAAAYEALTQAYPDKNLTPVMLLAEKQGTEYAILCYEIPADAESGFFETAFIGADGSGAVLSPLNLAD